MIDFSRNHFELFGLPQRYRFDPALLDARVPRAAVARCIPIASPRGTDSRTRLALQSSARVNEAYRALEGPGRARASICSRCTASTRSAETDTQLPLEFLERQLERREAAAEAAAARDERTLDGAAARSRARRRARRSRTQLAQTLDDERDYDAARDARARAHVPHQARRRHRRDARGAGSTDMALFQISEPGEAPRAARAEARDRHRPRHHQLAGRDRAPRSRRSCCPTTRVGRCVPSIVRYGEDGVEVGLRGDGASGERSAEHDRLGQAADGPRARRSRRRPPLSVSLRRHAGHGAHRDARRREVAGRDLRRDPARAARARRSVARRADRRRGRDRARVLRRRAAAGDQGRGAARRACRCCAC